MMYVLLLDRVRAPLISYRLFNSSAGVCGVGYRGLQSSCLSNKPTWPGAPLHVLSPFFRVQKTHTCADVAAKLTPIKDLKVRMHFEQYIRQSTAYITGLQRNSKGVNLTIYSQFDDVHNDEFDGITIRNSGYNDM